MNKCDIVRLFTDVDGLSMLCAWVLELIDIYQDYSTHGTNYLCSGVCQSDYALSARTISKRVWSVRVMIELTSVAIG